MSDELIGKYAKLNSRVESCRKMWWSLSMFLPEIEWLECSRPKSPFSIHRRCNGSKYHLINSLFKRWLTTNFTSTFACASEIQRYPHIIYAAEQTQGRATLKIPNFNSLWIINQKIYEKEEELNSFHWSRHTLTRPNWFPISSSSWSSGFAIIIVALRCLALSLDGIDMHTWARMLIYREFGRKIWTNSRDSYHLSLIKDLHGI